MMTRRMCGRTGWWKRSLEQAQWSDEPEGFNGMYRLDLRPVQS